MDYAKVSTRLDEIDEVVSAIKQVIINAIINGESKESTERSINKIIKAAHKIDYITPEMINSIKSMSQKLYYEFQTNLKTLLSSIKKEAKRLVRSYSIGSKFKYEYEFDYMSDEDPVKVFAEINQIDTSFRGHVTSADIAVPLIKDYEKKVRDLYNQLALAEPKVDCNGRQINLRAYAEMKVRFEETQTDLERLKSEGTQYAFISSHANCSKRCERWQGELVNLTAPAKSATLSTGETIDGMTVYSLTAIIASDPKGNTIIDGYNCRHYLIPYKPGSHQKRPTKYDFERMEEERKIDDKINKAELAIRKLQEKLQMPLLKQKERQELKRKLRKRSESYKKYCAQHNRATNPNRTAIFRKKSKFIVEGKTKTKVVDYQTILVESFTTALIEELCQRNSIVTSAEKFANKLKKEILEKLKKEEDKE